MKSQLPADTSRRQRLRLLWLIAGLWTAFVVAAAVWYIATEVREHRAQVLSESSVRLAGVRDSLNLTFRQLAALPKNLAHRNSIITFLSKRQLSDTSTLSEQERVRLRDELSRDPAVQQTNEILDRAVQDFGLQLALLIDKNGTTTANGIADKARQPSTIAGYLGGREYFTESMHHGESAQFLLGRQSRVPGFYFGHRVELDGKALGVIVIKQDSDTLNRLLSDSEGSLICVTDINGVTVLGNRAATLLQR